MPKLLALLMSFAMVLGICGVQLPVYAADAQSPVQITIFHTNDMHGRLLDAQKNGALTQIGSDYVTSIKKSVTNSLLIDAGDATQGVTFSTLSKGADVIRLMNAAGYDGMTLGNHEFDYGQEQLISNAKLASFPLVSANTMKNGNPLLSGINGNNGADFIKTVNGVKVGFFGITTQETAYKTNPNNLLGVTFADPIETSKTEVKKLQGEGAKVIVAITHIGDDPSSSPISDDIANKVSGINAIIDGHSHTVENKTINGTLIAQTSCYSANVGRIDISIDGNGKVTSKETLIPAKEVIKDGYKPDTSVSAIADKINDSQKSLLAQMIGKTATSLWAGTVDGTSVARLGETNLGDLVADSMVDGGKSQVKGTKYENLPIVSLENGGGVRDTLYAGDINEGQVISVLPFGNILSLKEVTPDVLYKVIENGVSSIKGQDKTTGVITGADGRFPQISGMRFEYDPTKPSQSRVTKIVLLNADGTDGKVLDKNDTSTPIVLVSNDYEIAGGDGYTMLGSLKNIGEGAALDAVFGSYVQKLTSQNGGMLKYPVSQGRIKVASNYVYKPYTATIEVDGMPGTKVAYSIDGGETKNATTDNNGILTIENVPSGPHNVSISANGKAADAYINDVIGLTTSDKVSVSLSDVSTAEVKSVSDAIAALPENVTLSNKDDVAKAVAAYGKLTDTQKTMVSNYDKLTAASAQIKKLEDEEASKKNAQPASQTQNTKVSTAKMPKTGSAVDSERLIAASLLLMVSGAAVLVLRKKTVKGSRN